MPFNVATIGNDIVVTYVLDPPGQQLPTAGPGFGYVNIFSSTGQLLQRLEHGSWLNVPWGVALAYAPFSEIFPYAAVVVHQGGIGTTSSQREGLVSALTTRKSVRS